MKKLADAIARFGAPRKFPMVEPDAARPRDEVILMTSDEQLLRAEVEALQKLLNDKDAEIDYLRNVKPLTPSELWGAIALVATVLLAAYLGFM